MGLPSKSLGGSATCWCGRVVPTFSTAVSSPSPALCHQGHQKQIDPDTFRDFYNCWKETEAEAQEVSLPAVVMQHLDKSECVYKLSSAVKTSRGVGKIAMTQKRLFLLTEGRPGYVEISTFRDIEVNCPLPHSTSGVSALRLEGAHLVAWVRAQRVK